MKEKTVYQLVAVICFTMFIFTGHKYVKLKSAYKEAVSEKVYYCKEYHKAKCSIEGFLDKE